MTKHVWEIEEVDGGPVGIGEFWICKKCGASGGPVWNGRDNSRTKNTNSAFYADGSGLQVDAGNCDLAKVQIDRHKRNKRDKRGKK